MTPHAPTHSGQFVMAGPELCGTCGLTFTNKKMHPTDRTEVRIDRPDPEVLHAEHHSGTIVPTLDSCTEHTRAEYEALADSLTHLEPTKLTDTAKLKARLIGAIEYIEGIERDAENSRVAEARARLQRDVAITDAEMQKDRADQLSARLMAVQDALANYPSPICDVHDDDDPITCGWKRAVIDVERALNPIKPKGTP